MFESFTERTNRVDLKQSYECTLIIAACKKLEKRVMSYSLRNEKHFWIIPLTMQSKRYSKQCKLNANASELFILNALHCKNKIWSEHCSRWWVMLLVRFLTSLMCHLNFTCISDVMPVGARDALTWAWAHGRQVLEFMTFFYLFL